MFSRFVHSEVSMEKIFQSFKIAFSDINMRKLFIILLLGTLLGAVVGILANDIRFGSFVGGIIEFIALALLLVFAS